MPPLTRWFIKSAFVYFVAAMAVRLIQSAGTMVDLPAFLNALGLWHPSGAGQPGQLITFGDGPGEPAHSGVVSEASNGKASKAIMTTSYGGPLAVREVTLQPYLRAHPEFFIAGYGDPPGVTPPLS